MKMFNFPQIFKQVVNKGDLIPSSKSLRLKTQTIINSVCDSKEGQNDEGFSRKSSKMVFSTTKNIEFPKQSRSLIRRFNCKKKMQTEFKYQPRVQIQGTRSIENNNEFDISSEGKITIDNNLQSKFTIEKTNRELNSINKPDVSNKLRIRKIKQNLENRNQNNNQINNNKKKKLTFKVKSDSFSGSIQGLHSIDNDRQITVNIIPYAETNEIIKMDKSNQKIETEDNAQTFQGKLKKLSYQDTSQFKSSYYSFQAHSNKKINRIDRKSKTMLSTHKKFVFDNEYDYLSNQNKKFKGSSRGKTTEGSKRIIPKQFDDDFDEEIKNMKFDRNGVKNEDKLMKKVVNGKKVQFQKRASIDHQIQKSTNVNKNTRVSLIKSKKQKTKKKTFTIKKNRSNNFSINEEGSMTPEQSKKKIFKKMMKINDIYSYLDYFNSRNQGRCESESDNQITSMNIPKPIACEISEDRKFEEIQRKTMTKRENLLIDMGVKIAKDKILKQIRA